MVKLKRNQFVNFSTLLLAFGIGLSAHGKSVGAGKNTSSTSPRKGAVKGPVKLTEPVNDFDRLDGKGLTRKRVDVIEWEGNLEIHVYPKNSLKSLGLKVDRTDKDRNIMVIEYQFNGVPYTLVRRAVLSVKFMDSFKTFQDPSTEGYDKILISNNTLDASVKPFLAVHEPRQMYPDGYGEPEGAVLADSEEESPDSELKSPSRRTASDEPAKIYDGVHPNARNAPGVKMREEKKPPPNLDEDGNIRSFEF
jgi:hypothetical protein